MNRTAFAAAFAACLLLAACQTPPAATGEAPAASPPSLFDTPAPPPAPAKHGPSPREAGIASRQDAARARMTAKRGAGDYAFTESLDSLAAAAPEDEDVVRLGEALQRLARLDPNLAQLIDCRFFAGMTEEETAKVLGVSDRTVRRWWLQARAWVHKEMDAG